MIKTYSIYCWPTDQDDRHWTYRMQHSRYLIFDLDFSFYIRYIWTPTDFHFHWNHFPTWNSHFYSKYDIWYLVSYSEQLFEIVSRSCWCKINIMNIIRIKTSCRLNAVVQPSAYKVQRCENKLISQQKMSCVTSARRLTSSRAECVCVRKEKWKRYLS